MVTQKKSGAGQMLGVTGLSIWGGVLGEEYLTALKGTRKAKVFKEMQDDAVIGTLLDSMWMPLMAAEFETTPAGETPQDKLNTEFLDQVMNDMTRYSWRQHVLDALSMMVWGWSASEMVFKKRLGPEGNPSSQFNDGKIGLHILDPRGQETLHHWKMDEEFTVESMFQQDPNSGRLIEIPAWKMLHATFRSRKRSPEGSSPLRSLYRAWYTRKNLEVLEAIGAERDLAGLPVIYLPYGATDTDKAAAETLVRNLRQDEEAGIILPAPPSPDTEHGKTGWKFELIGSPGSKQFNVRQIIQDLNKIILMRFFAQFLMLGMEQVGTQALVEGSQDFFSLALKSIQHELEETWNQQLVPLLFSMNPGMLSGASGLPQIDWAEPGSKDIAKIVAAAQAMVSAQLLTPDQSLEDFLRATVGFPDRPAGVGEGPRTAAPQSPFGPQFMNYEWYVQPDGGWMIKPRQTKKFTQFKADLGGAMLAISVPADVASKIALPGGEPVDRLHITLAFLGDNVPEQMLQIARNVLAAVSAQQPPLEVQLSGTGTFPVKDGEQPFYAKVDSPELVKFREKLATALDIAGVAYSKDYEYHPHVTLAYLKGGDVPKANVEAKFTASQVVLYVGGQREAWPLAKQMSQPDPGDVHIPTAIDNEKKRRDQCMNCSAAPTVDIVWGEGYRAWFCEKCYAEWLAESETHEVIADTVDFGVSVTEKYAGGLDYLEVASYVEIAGIKGRRATTRIGRATNEYQGLLTAIYDRWSRKAQKAMLSAGERKGLVKEVDKQLLALAMDLKAAAGKHIDEAVRLGLKGPLDKQAMKLVSKQVETNNKFVDESLIPRIREKIVSHLDELEKQHQYQLDEIALLGLLTSMRTEPTGYAGAFWSAIFLGAGLGRGSEDRTRVAAGAKPRRVRWVLDPAAEHCKKSEFHYGCPDLAGEYDSWASMPTVPAGSVSCLGNCRCGIEVQNDVGGWDRVA